MPKQRIALEDILSYADIAEQLGVKVSSVRMYATYDKDFPSPITPKSMRSPGFARDDVAKYVERKRGGSDSGKGGGRPPADSTDRLPLNAEIGKRIRAIYAERRPASTVSLMKDLVEVVGLSQPAFNRRMAGTLPWKRSELRDVAKAIGADVAEISGGEEL